MGQLIVCKTAHGIVVGSDSGAVRFEPEGEERLITQEHLFPVGSHAVVGSAGAVDATGLVKEFVTFAQEEKLTDIDGLIEAVVPFFTGRYDDYMRKMCDKLPLEPILNLYVVLAGYAARTPADPWRLIIMWNRVRPPKIDVDRQVTVFTLPRRLGMEVTLNRLIAAQTPLAEVTAAAQAGMEKQAITDEYIKPPYQFCTITAEGVKAV